MKSVAHSTIGSTMKSVMRRGKVRRASLRTGFRIAHSSWDVSTIPSTSTACFSFWPTPGSPRLPGSSPSSCASSICPNGVPPRYEDILWGSIAFVAVGKALVFTFLGMHRKWWRYFALRDFGVVHPRHGGRDRRS